MLFEVDPLDAVALVSAALVLVGAAALAWAAAWALVSGVSPMHPRGAALNWATYSRAVAMWQAMMIAMMTPSVAPWVAAFGRLASNAPGDRAIGPSVAFASGYFTIWLAYSVVAAALQLGLSAAGLVGHERPTAILAALVLAAAGLFQFAPFRQTCLTHCRNPISVPSLCRKPN